MKYCGHLTLIQIRSVLSWVNIAHCACRDIAKCPWRFIVTSCKRPGHYCRTPCVLHWILKSIAQSKVIIYIHHSHIMCFSKWMREVLWRWYTAVLYILKWRNNNTFSQWKCSRTAWVNLHGTPLSSLYDAHVCLCYRFNHQIRHYYIRPWSKAHRSLMEKSSGISSIIMVFQQNMLERAV